MQAPVPSNQKPYQGKTISAGSFQVRIQKTFWNKRFEVQFYSFLKIASVNAGWFWRFIIRYNSLCLKDPFHGKPEAHSIS
jgi:hypothetical protein